MPIDTQFAWRWLHFLELLTDAENSKAHDLFKFSWNFSAFVRVTKNNEYI